MNQQSTKGMNFFKVKSIAILLPGCFIVFCIVILQLVEADLPNKDRLQAIPCVKVVFGENFVRKSFKSDRNTLSDGEYLGGLCEDLSEEDIKNLIKKQPEGTHDYDGEKMKTCLESTSSGLLFDKYRKLGANVQRNEPGLEHLSAASEVPEDTSYEYADLSASPIFHFFLGICQSKEEEVEFVNVTGDEDKEKIVSCLGQCAGTFMKRIEKNLELGKTDAITLLNAEIKVIEQTSLKSPENSIKVDQQIVEEEAKKKDLKAQIQRLTNNVKIKEPAKSYIDHEHKIPKKFDSIEEMGKDNLDNYSDFYHQVNQYVRNYDRQSYDGLKDLDTNLYTSFSLYQDCSRIGCGMTLNSTPFYKLIQEGAKDLDPNAPKTSMEHIRAKAEKILANWYTPKKRIFFKALVDIPKTTSQTENDESQ